VKRSEIGLNHVYEAKVAGRLAPVRILVAHVAGEVLMDGTTCSWRPRLGLPERE
jgi:hypothetical protein